MYFYSIRVAYLIGGCSTNQRHFTGPPINYCLNLRKTPVVNGRAFVGVSGPEGNLARYAENSRKFLTKNFRSI